MPFGLPAGPRGGGPQLRELLARDFDVVDAGMLAVRRGRRPRQRDPPGGASRCGRVAPDDGCAAELHGPRARRASTRRSSSGTRPTIDRLPDALTQSQATVNSSQVAAVMLANPFVRAGRPFATVTASPADEAGMSTLTRTVRAAAAASALRGASVLRVGSWIPGYLDVESTGAELARLGVTEHAVDGARAERRLRRGRGRSRRPRSSRRSPAAGGRATPARPTSGACVSRWRSATSPRRRRRRRHRQLPLRRAALEPARSGSRPASAPRSSPPAGSRSPARATCRRRSRS